MLKKYDRLIGGSRRFPSSLQKGSPSKAVVCVGVLKQYDRLVEGSCLIYSFRVTGANSPVAPSDFYRPMKGYRLIQTALLGDRYTVNPTAEYLKSSDLVAQSVGTVVSGYLSPQQQQSTARAHLERHSNTIRSEQRSPSIVAGTFCLTRIVLA